MTSVLVLCDHASPQAASGRFDRELSINQSAPERNMRIEVRNISHWLLSTLAPVTRDLLDIATYVYYADNSVSRGTLRDVFNEAWRRRFTFVAPVREFDLWRQESVKAKLIAALEYLTDDEFEFIFVERQRTPEQLVIRGMREQLPPCPGADCISLFSGGMDSLAGAVYLHVAGRKPVLVSHQSRPVLTRLQRELSRQLRKRFPSSEFPRLGVWINRMGRRAMESSQRSRSFLFLALGTLVMHELGLTDLMVCENGITTFNLPRLGQTTGTLASRSTHPRFIRLFRELGCEVLGVDFKIETPFVWKTRGEVVEILKKYGCDDLVPLTVSCAQSRRPKIHPHCGLCSQCVDRRFAVLHAGLDAPDELNQYEKNIFTDALEEGQEIAQAMSPVRFALDMRGRNVDSFCQEYGQVYDAIDSLPGEAEDVLQKVFDLHRRFADEVHSVMARERGRNWDKIYNREYPDNCLFTITGPESPRRPDAIIGQRASELAERLRQCPVGETGPFQDVVEDVLSFLFCEDTSPEYALRKPDPQSKSDQGYTRRDLLFENRATEGFWAEARREYAASRVVADAKNYKDELDGEAVTSFASKYLRAYGVGRLGIVVARRVPIETRSAVSRNDRLPGAIEAQRNQWRDSGKMIILLSDDDLVEMMQTKAMGRDPTDLLRDRVFTLKARM